MYLLTIEELGRDVTTDHSTRAEARAALHAYAVLADYYHHHTGGGATHDSYELMSLAQRSPRPVGTATIAVCSPRDIEITVDLVMRRRGCPAARQ